MTVQCPCGNSFDRSPGRGRPAVWCEACRTLPMNQRVSRPVVTDEDGEVVVEHRVSRYGEHDALSYNEREAVEAGWIELQERYRTEIWPNRATLFAGAANVDRAAAEYCQQMITDLYTKEAPDWWQPSRKKTQ